MWLLCFPLKEKSSDYYPVLPEILTRKLEGLKAALSRKHQELKSDPDPSVLARFQQDLRGLTKGGPGNVWARTEIDRCRKMRRVKSSGMIEQIAIDLG